MKSKYSYTLFIALLWLLSGCEPANHSEAGEGGQDPILLASLTTETTPAASRAVSDFPNNGSIGVVAATVYDPENPQANWTTYPDINNAEAMATSEANGVFGFTWRQSKYWPFDGSNLYFMAYSPVAGSANYFLLSEDRTSLTLALDPNLPDVMYASANTDIQPYNKTSGTVSLGQFRHVLSKLTIEVVAGPGMSENIVVNNLSVRTPLRTANFTLYGGEDALAVEEADEPYLATLVSGNVHFSNQPLVNTLFLFPGSQDQVEVSITLVDTSNNLTYSADYMVSFFTDGSAQPVVLERARNTVLTINVINIGVEDPDRNILLEGTLEDWNYQGEFGIPIN